MNGVGDGRWSLPERNPMEFNQLYLLKILLFDPSPVCEKLCLTNEYHIPRSIGMVLSKKMNSELPQEMSQNKFRNLPNHVAKHMIGVRHAA